MSFYTNIQTLGNDILVRSVEEGERAKYTDRYYPKVYVKNNDPSGKSERTSIDGLPLSSLTPGNIKETRAFIEQYKGVSGFDLYGVVDWNHMYIGEMFLDCNYDFEKIRICTIDIETESENGFPEVELAREKITVITIKDSFTGNYFVFGLGPFTTSRDDVNYLRCSTEEELLEKFLEVYSVLSQDVITGWISILFDMAYLIRRMQKLFDDKKHLKLSPWGKVKEKLITVLGREHYSYHISGVAQLDYLDLYKKFTYTNQESYKLGHISWVELEEEKLSYEEYDNIHTFYKSDYQKFVEYNIKDVELVDRLEDKLKLIELCITMAYDAGINYEDVFSQVRTWDALIYNHLNKKGVAICPRTHGQKDKEYEGAYVKTIPENGISGDWIVSFDLNSLYPHLIMQYNISPDTMLDEDAYLPYKGDDKEKQLIQDILDEKVDLPELAGKTLAANGKYFRTDKQGFLPELMQKMYDERVEAKRLMIAAEKKREAGDRTVENDIAKYNNIQMAKKIALNSAYGALGNQYFRYFNIEQAEAITYSGQLSIRWIETKLNKYLNETLRTDGVDYVIASDTDSVYLTLDTMVKTHFSNITDKNKIVGVLDRVCIDLIEPFIKKSYQDLADTLNVYEQKMFMSREAIADKGIWTAKKRYILNVYDNEGIRYKEPKLKIMGIEAVRSSTPSACRERIKESLELIMTKDEIELHEYVANFKEEFYGLEPGDVSFPRTVNGVNKYYCPREGCKKGTPLHVRGSLVYNKLLDSNNLQTMYPRIREGEKIKFTYLKEPNPSRSKVIAFLNNIPSEFSLKSYVDYDLQFEKSYLDPLKTVLDVVGWSYEKQSNLESFFS